MSIRSNYFVPDLFFFLVSSYPLPLVKHRASADGLAVILARNASEVIDFVGRFEKGLQSVTRDLLPSSFEATTTTTTKKKKKKKKNNNNNNNKKNKKKKKKNRTEQEARSTDPSSSWIVQRYLSRPLLVAGRKVDLRLYCMLAAAAPLPRLYCHNDASMVRSALEAYEGSVPPAENESGEPEENQARVRRAHLTASSEMSDMKWNVSQHPMSIIRPIAGEESDVTATKAKATAATGRVMTKPLWNRVLQQVGRVFDASLRAAAVHVVRQGGPPGFDGANSGADAMHRSLAAPCRFKMYGVDVLLAWPESSRAEATEAEAQRGHRPDVFILEVNPLPAIGKETRKRSPLGAAKAIYAADAAAMLHGFLGDLAIVERMEEMSKLEREHKAIEEAVDAACAAEGVDGKPRLRTKVEVRASKNRAKFRKQKKETLLPADATGPVVERFLWSTKVVAASMAKSKEGQTPGLGVMREAMRELTLAILEFDRRGNFSFVPLQSSLVPTRGGDTEHATYAAASGAMVEWAKLASRRSPTTQKRKPRDGGDEAGDRAGSTRQHGGHVVNVNDYEDEDDDDEEEDEWEVEWDEAEFAEV